MREGTTLNNVIASVLRGSGTVSKALASLDTGTVPRISSRAVTVIAEPYFAYVFVALNIFSAPI